MLRKKCDTVKKLSVVVLALCAACLLAGCGEKLAEFGFILRYPEDGAYYTGCAYEPRHIRYVGTDTAREITGRGITLEEYLDAA